MADFPTTSLLSEFQGPDENPLYENGSWSPYPNNIPPLQRKNNGAIVTVEFAVNGMYWTRDTYTGLAEVWACVGGGGLGAALETWRVALWQDDPGLRTGYLTYFGGGIGEAYAIRRYDNGSFTDIAGLDTTSPEKIGMRLTPTHVECWAYFSSQWNFIVSAADTTYRGTFFAAIELEEQGGIGNLGMGCFGAGVINRQHIYRVIRAQQGVPA